MQQKQENISIPTLLQHSSNLEYGLAESISFDPKNFQCQNTSCFTSRKAKSYLRNWKKVCRMPIFCQLLRGSKLFFPKTISAYPASNVKDESEVIGDTWNNKERCNSLSIISSGAIFKQFILSGQEGTKSQSCDKFEIPKQFHSLSEF